ncbi:MAG TPA: hypothetical protein VGL39_22505 [Jatrophihabitantaceae bacterium]|jgi:hypothetical protein
MSNRTRHLPGARLRLLAVAAAGALVALMAPIAAPSALPQAHAEGTTITGTRSGDFAWDPKTNAPMTAAPSVSVDQTDNLTDQVVHVTWKNFSPTTDLSGNPIPSYKAGGGSAYYPVQIRQCRGVDPAVTWRSDTQTCYSFTPDNPNSDHGVGNVANAITGPTNTGEAFFHVETSQANDQLGCSVTQACSLVIVPNWGGVQPKSGTGVSCADHSKDKGNLLGRYASDNNIALSCSWADRFVVPLHFAPTPNDCPAKEPAFATQGSPMLERAMQLWQAGWCTDSAPLSLDFDSGTNEYLARESFLSGSGALTSATDVAAVTRPAGSLPAGARHFTYAPLATSGIAIAVRVDDPSTGGFVSNVTLNARLMAKLLTQSYALRYGCTNSADPSKQAADCDPGVRGNPVSIFADPEFQHLNPGFPSHSADVNIGQFLPLVLAGNSDLTYELTRWIESDPDAAAFLDGKPDESGMHVNTYYRGIDYPLDQFQVQDPGYAGPGPTNHPGWGTMQVAWSPISGLDNVVTSALIDRPSGVDITVPQGDCAQNCVYARMAPSLIGSRVTFAVVDAGDAAAEQFPVARLVNGAGVAVAPTTQSMAAAVKGMTTNVDKITQSANFDNTDPKAYPLTMVDYAMVPTCGLSGAKANAIGALLDKAASTQYGQEPGTLAPGYVALNAGQKSQSAAAAQAVRAQACPPNPPTGNPPSDNGGGNNDNNGGGSGGSASTDGAGGNGATGSGSGSGLASSTGPTSGAGPHSVTGQSPNAVPAAFGTKHGDSAGPARLVLPILLAVGGVLLLGGPGVYLAWASGAGPNIARRLRSLLRFGRGH